MKILSIAEGPLRYLKTYTITYEDRHGQPKVWEMVSRGDMQRITREIEKQENVSDGSMIVAFSEDRTQVVMVKEFRVIAGRYIYAFPAGLSDEGESLEQTSVREFKEETGLDFHYEGFEGPRYTSVGLSNEKVHTVFGTFSGSISREYLESSEDIEAVIVDRQEALRILKEEECTIRSAFILYKIFDIPFYTET